MRLVYGNVLCDKFILDFNQIPIAKQFIINYFALYIKISTFANHQMI